MIIFLRLIFRFDLASSIPLSNLSIAAAGVVVYSLNFSKHHHLKKDTTGKPCGTLPDFNLILVMFPMGIIGSAIGSIITATLPEPILVGVLEPFLIYLIIISS